MSVDWAEIYRASYRELVRFLHRRVWDADRAEELAQETFVRALGQEPENPRAWLYRVATNLARDEARLVVRRKRHLVLLRSEASAGAAPPSAEAERAERREAVRRALERLSERDRDVLLLWDAGLSYAEIAAQTGLAPTAVGTTLARARQRLVDAHTALEETHVARG